MSHLKLLEMAKTKNLEYIVIVEDDIQFTKPEQYNYMLSEFNKFMKKNENNLWKIYSTPRTDFCHQYQQARNKSQAMKRDQTNRKLTKIQYNLITNSM